MNKYYGHSLRTAGTLALLGTFSSLASAQDAGTNVATPPPAQTPTALAGPGTPAEPPSPTDASVSMANEPVIDATTNRKTLPNRPLLITGGVVLGASYGASAIVGAVSDREADDKLFYPVVGPWLDLNHRGCSADPCSNKTLYQALLIGDGIVQGLGALSIVLSVMIPETTTRSWYLIGNQDIVVVPQVGTSNTGLVAVGRF